MATRQRDLVRVCAVLAALAVLALALSACAPGPPAVGTATRTAAEPPPCEPAAIEISVADGMPAAGSRSLVLTLANEGDHACTLGGHTPAILLLDGSGSPIPTRQEDSGPADARTPVHIVAPGAPVSSTVSWRVVPLAPDADPGRDCPDAAGLRLTLPGGAVDVGAPLTACDGGMLVATPYDVAA